MSGALLVSGFFLRRSAWSVEGAGWRSCDHLRDAPGCDLAHWLDQAAATLAGEERVILCGHSFGGYLAQCLAARLGERAAHLYLSSAPPPSLTSALNRYRCAARWKATRTAARTISSGYAASTRLEGGSAWKTAPASSNCSAPRCRPAPANPRNC